MSTDLAMALQYFFSCPNLRDLMNFIATNKDKCSKCTYSAISLYKIYNSCPLIKGCPVIAGPDFQSVKCFFDKCNIIFCN